MNIAQLTKALKHEAQTRPLKVGVLALLLLVAVYFWLPLAGQLLGLGRRDAPKSTAQIPELQLLTASVPETTAQLPVPELNWQQLHSARVANPLSHPAEIQQWTKDPFVANEPTDLASLDGNEERLFPSRTPTGDELGLQLSGIIMSANKRLAMINGRSYRPHDAIELSNGDSAIVQEIHNRHVVLSYQDHQIELIIPKPFER